MPPTFAILNRRRADVVIVLDSSNNINDQEWNTVLKFAQTLVHNADLTQDAAWDLSIPSAVDALMTAAPDSLIRLALTRYEEALH